MHVSGGVGSDHADFLVLSAFAAPVFVLACKDDVGCLLVGEFVVHGSDCGPSARGGGAGGGAPAGGGGASPSPLEIRVSQWHFRDVWLDGFAPLWNLQGASRVCS